MGGTEEKQKGDDDYESWARQRFLGGKKGHMEGDSGWGPLLECWNVLFLNWVVLLVVILFC